MRDITIMDLTTINANLINFSVMALILNKSSNAAGQRHRQQNMINPTLLQFIMNSQNPSSRECDGSPGTTHSSDTPIRLTTSDEEQVFETSKVLSDNQADLTMMDKQIIEEDQRYETRKNR